MSSKAFHEKLEELCDFVIEVSRGNFTLQLSTDNVGDLEPLVMLHNMMNEELNTLVHNIHGSKSQPIVKSYSLKISSTLDLLYVSSSLLKDLEIKEQPANLGNLLTAKSNKKLLKLLAKTDFVFNSEKKLKLEFKNSANLILKTKATLVILNDLNEDPIIMINAHRIIYKNSLLDKYQRKIEPTTYKYPSRNRSLLLQENRELIENLQSYLLKNLDQQFPGIKNLARKFNASESKLKKGFKYYYGTSIYLSLIHI